MKLSTERLKLRPWSEGDRDSLVRYANDRRISINMRDRFPFPYTEQDARDWIKIASAASPLANFAIEVDAHAVGGIGLMLGSDIFRCSAEIGYWLGHPYWGKGLMPEAVKLVTGYAFETFGVSRVFAGVFESNPASAKVLEKAGYHFESRMRKAIIKDGKIADQLMYVAIR